MANEHFFQYESEKNHRGSIRTSVTMSEAWGEILFLLLLIVLVLALASMKFNAAEIGTILQHLSQSWRS